MEHFNSLVWMTYRTNFPAIEGTNISTDCGWGCMVRSGQMILATTLNRFLLGPQWRLNGCTPEERRQHRQVGVIRLELLALGHYRVCNDSLTKYIIKVLYFKFNEILHRGVCGLKWFIKGIADHFMVMLRSAHE